MLFIGKIAMADEYKVLIILGDSSGQAESTVIKSFDKIGENTFKFTELNIATGATRPIAGAVKAADEVKNGKLNFSDYKIIWFTWNTPGHDSEYFLEGVEANLLKFVEGGGVIFISAFDDNFKDKNGNQIGTWMPIDKYPCTVQNTADTDVEITPEGEKSLLLNVPNKLVNADLNAITMDDNFAPAAKEYIVLATRVDNKQPAIVQLNYGKGAYVGCCYDARTSFPAATKLVQNALNYLASLGKTPTTTAVNPMTKISSVWGGLKVEH
jgi:hypothetical protein